MKIIPTPNQWIADFLMERGCLKYADARRCASQILRHLHYSEALDLLRRPYPNMHTMETSKWFHDRDEFLKNLKNLEK